MPQAVSDHTTSRPIRLSQLFADPVLRTAFRRAEDTGLGFSIDFATPPERPRCLDGGAAAAIVRECEEVV